MPNFAHKGINYYYLDSGEGVPFFFLHGMGGSTQQIQNVYEHIPNVRLITMDMQGHGKSDVCWDDYGFDAMADDVIALMNHLSIESAHVGGISMGAAVSVNAALRYPKRIKSLCLIRTAWTHLPMHEEIQYHFQVCAYYLKQNDISGYMATKEYGQLKEKSAYTAQSFTGNFSEPASLTHYKKFQLLPSMAPFDNPLQLQNITVPCLLLSNRNDYVHPFEYGEYYASKIPHCQSFEIPDKDRDAVGHKDQLNQYLHDFLRNIIGR